MQATGHCNFCVGGILGRHVAVIVEGDRHFGKSEGPTAVATGEDDVIHRPSAKLLGAHLAHAPTQGIDNVGFATSVRPNNAADALTEVEDDFVREGFETVYF